MEIRQKFYNPQSEDHWKEQLDFWSRVIESTQEKTDPRRFVFSLSELKERFYRFKLHPKCLPDVVAHMIDTNKIEVAREAPEVVREAPSTPGKVMNGLSSIISTVISMVTGPRDPPKPGMNEPLMLSGDFEKVMGGIQWREHSYIRTLDGCDLVSQREVRERAKLSTVVLAHLIRQQRILEVKSKCEGLAPETFLKMPRSDTKVRPVTDRDQYLVDHWTVERYVSQEIDRKEQKLAELKRDYTLRLKKARVSKPDAKLPKEVRLWFLKRFKSLKKSLDNSYKQRDNLSTIRDTILQQQSNEMVLRAMERGRDTIAQANQAMSADDVEQLYQDVQEQVAEADEVNTAISAPIGDDVDDEELRELERELQREEDMQLAAVRRSDDRKEAVGFVKRGQISAAGADVQVKREAKKPRLALSKDIKQRESKVALEL